MSEPICVDIGGITQPLVKWAEDYGLSRFTIYQRYRAGMQGDDLIAPVTNDILSKEYLHKLRGGRWSFAPEKPEKVNEKYYKGNYRWVYVGRK